MTINKAAIIGVCAAMALVAEVGLGHAQQAQDQSKGQTGAKATASGSSPAHDSVGGMDMSGAHYGASGVETQSADSAMAAMAHHMHMSEHMFMTALRPENAADEKRAESIVAVLQPAIAKYRDYNVALADGFKIFHPEIPQEHYHFTNYAYAAEAHFKFDPARPTSLLYKKTAAGYELEGAMYTAPKRATEEELNERVPLSVAQWHKHTNLCLPPNGGAITPVNRKEFGLDGSIATEEACTAAGGRWIPQIFGWMVHVYPYESEPEKIWAH